MRLEIRAPHPAEEPVCRMLLPETAGDAGWREYLLAISGETPFYVGAVSWLRIPGSVRGLCLRVVHTRLREGTGSRLLRAAVEAAERRGDGELHCQADPVRDPVAAPFLLARGFNRSGLYRGFETELEPVLAYSSGWSRRLAEAGKIPADARVVALRDAPVEDVARLYAAYIAANPGLPCRSVQAVIEAGAFDQSRVLRCGGRVAGMILGTAHPPRIEVDAWVIEPELRGGWATMLLLADATRTGWDLGGRRIRFHASDHAPETLAMARRFGAQTIETLESFRLQLGG